MFKRLRLTALFTLFSFVAIMIIDIPVIAQSAPLASVNDFVVFYGDVSAENIPQIISYDLAVVEPSAIDSSEMSQLKSAAILLFGYYSVHEVEPYDTRKISLMNESDYLYINGIKDYNSKYDCFNGDIRSAHFQEISLQIIKERIVDKGYQGVFLDTMDDIEAITDPVLKEELLRGYLGFLDRLNQTFPNLLIIQNRSFSLYLRGSSQSVDAIVYEGFNHTKFESLPYYQNLASQLSEVANRDHDVIMAISHTDAAANFEMCKSFRWLYTYCPTSNNYLKLETNRFSIDLIDEPMVTETHETTMTQQSLPESQLSQVPSVSESSDTTMTQTTTRSSGQTSKKTQKSTKKRR